MINAYIDHYHIIILFPQYLTEVAVSGVVLLNDLVMCELF